MREKEDEYYWWYFSEISCVYGYVFLEPKREQVVLLADVSNIFQTLKLEQNSLFQLILNKLKILHKYTIKLKYFWEISFTFLLLQSSCSILLLLFGISHLPTADSIFLGRLAWNRDVLLTQHNSWPSSRSSRTISVVRDSTHPSSALQQ